MNDDTRKAQPWFAPLTQLASKGACAARPGSLAGLHEARKQHEGQFFTPQSLTNCIWRLISPVMDRAIASQGGKVAILDNAIGSGRLIYPANPSKHFLAGADVDEACVNAVARATEANGFATDLVVSGMEALNPMGYGVAILNPPFSLQLESPLLTPYECTHWGAHGENTAALSHEYAVRQALDAADIVVAILPTPAADAYLSSTVDMIQDRLRAVVRLPRGAFRTEGTEVSTSIVVFARHSAYDLNQSKLPLPAVQTWDMKSFDAPWPELHLKCSTMAQRMPKPLDPAMVQASLSKSLGEVTGIQRVRVVKAGRYIRLKFQCALVHAKVMNGLLRDPVAPMENHRYPKGIRFQGEGQFDLEIYLLQDDPEAAFQQFLGSIRNHGGEPAVDASLCQYLRKASRRVKRERTPFSHTTRHASAALTSGHACVRRDRPLNTNAWGSAILREGQEVAYAAGPDGKITVTANHQSALLEERDFKEDFELKACHSAGWVQVHTSPAKYFPQQAKAAMARARSTGALTIASWDYQQQDLVELRLVRGAVAAWRMGCGKTRLAIALCLAGGQHNAIVVESHLIEEIVDQIQELELPESEWQVITKPSQCRDLRRINIISYNRLRSPICKGAGRRTMARYLRRRLSTVCADEAHLLRNRHTAQTQALWMLSPRRRYALTGTPQANQVQDLLPLTQWACGDGTARQPYGWYHPFLEKRLLKSMTAAQRGLEAFMERHAVFEWVTHEWNDRMTGAKRQVPKVNRIGQLREWVAPLIKRRHEQEPDVASHFSVPTATKKVVTVDWDEAHLSHYLRTADLFAQWYREACRAASKGEKNLNLAMILARIGAVLRACNFPQYDGKGNQGIAPYLPLTSKQEAVLDELEHLTEDGHKTICYTDGPGQVDLLVRELGARGVDAVPFHGKIPIKQRTRALNDRFRHGEAPVLVATIAVTQTGLNLWQADREIFTCRSWSATQEDQAIARALRPQQTRPVEVTFFHLEGSIDEYMAQMVAMKVDAAGAAVDGLEPIQSDREFIHMDRILDQFVADVADRRGLNAHEFRETLHAA